MTEKSGGTGNKVASSVTRRNLLKTAGASAVLSTSGLAGCAERSGDSGGDGQSGGQAGNANGRRIVIKAWLGLLTEGPSVQTFFQDVKARFEAEHPNIYIDLQAVSYQVILTEFRAARAAGEEAAPDIIEVDPAILAGDNVMPVTDMYEDSRTKEIAADLIQPIIEAEAQQAGYDEQVGWPFATRPHISVWRKDWLDQAGISPSEVDHTAGALHWEDEIGPIFDQLIQTELGQQDGHYPSSTCMSVQDNEFISLYYPQFGGSITGPVNAEGTAAVINEDPALNAIRYQVEGVRDNGHFDPGALNGGDETATTLFWSGKAAECHLQDSVDIWNSFRTKKAEMWENGEMIFGLPHKAGQKTSYNNPGSFAFVNKEWSQEKKDAAATFLDFLIVDNGLGLTQNAGSAPIAPSLIKEEDWFGDTEQKRQLWQGAVYKTLKNFITSSECTVPAQRSIQYDIPNRMYSEILLNDVPIEEAANNAADDINSLLAKHGRR